MFDLVIKNGTVIDGTGRAGFRADVAVVGDTIAAIGSLPAHQARRIVDAQGLVVAPGFVDIHSHSDYHLFLHPEASSSLRQGVTTEIGGNCGYSAAPIAGEAFEERKKLYKEAFGWEPSWQSLSEFHEALEAIRPGVNFGLYAGHNTIRASVLGNGDLPCDKECLEGMAALLRQALAQGAFGLSTGLIYPPACYASCQELVFLGKVCAQAGGIFAVHLRSEGAGLLPAISEALEVARLAGIPLQISHLKTSGRENWPKLEEAFQLIEQARAQGLNVTCDRYPYVASNTGLPALLPKWAVAGSLAEKLARLQDGPTRASIAAQLSAEHPDDTFWQSVALAEVTTDKNKPLEGITVSQAACQRGLKEVDFVLQLLKEEEFKVTCLIHSMSEENLRKILKKPYVMIGSDSGCRSTTGPLARGMVHPRIFGTFARVLAKYVREEGVLTLEEAIKKMTLDPCSKLGLVDRGRIAPGFKADLAIFSPNEIKDLASYGHPFQYPQGVCYVIVNGQMAVDQGKVTTVRAGRILLKRDRN